MTSSAAPGVAAPWSSGPAGLVRGVALFLVLTGLGLGALPGVTGGGGAGWASVDPAPLFVVLALAAAGADLLLGAARYQIFIRELLPGASLWLPLRADLANRFVGAVTPSQTGGLPAQLWVLHRGGVPVSDSLAFLAINFLATLLFFLIAGTLTALALQDHFSQAAVRFLLQYGFVAFAVVLGFILVAMIRPDLVAGPLERGVLRLEGSRLRWMRAVARPGRILVRSSERYTRTMRHLVRRRPGLLVATALLTTLLYLNKFTIAWLLMRGMGVEADYGLTLGVQAILHFVLYFAPTPGASGLGEISTGALMAVLLPDQLLLLFTAAFRALTVYLPAVVGGVVLWGLLRGGPRRSPAALAGEVPAVGCLLLLLLPLGTAAAQPDRAGAAAGVAGACGVRGSEVVEAAVLAPVWAWIRTGIAEEREEAAEAAFARAVVLARERVECLPGSADAHHVLSVALGLHMELQGIRTRVRMAGEVRDEATAALELDPDHAGAHHVLGRLYAGIMRMGTMETFVARRLLGGGWIEHATWARAESHFLRARELDPENPFHGMELGSLYLDTGREALARQELARAAALPSRAPEDAVAIHRARSRLALLECRGECPP